MGDWKVLNVDKINHNKSAATRTQYKVLRCKYGTNHTSKKPWSNSSSTGPNKLKKKKKASYGAGAATAPHDSETQQDSRNTCWTAPRSRALCFTPCICGTSGHRRSHWLFGRFRVCPRCVQGRCSRHRCRLLKEQRKTAMGHAGGGKSSHGDEGSKRTLTVSLSPSEPLLEPPCRDEYTQLWSSWFCWCCIDQQGAAESVLKKNTHTKKRDQKSVPKNYSKN